MLRKRLAAAVAAVALLVAVAPMPSQAETVDLTQWQGLPSYKGKDLPPWLHNATPIDPSQAAEVRGEWYYWVVQGVRYAWPGLYSCAMTGICPGPIFQTYADWLLANYPAGCNPCGGGGGGSW